jgi:hypothetical protein
MKMYLSTVSINSLMVTLFETFNEGNYLGNLDSWYNNVKMYLRWMGS